MLKAAEEKMKGSRPKAGGSPSIAVLPFVNMSRDEENEYFSDGLSEELLNVLAKVPELKVTGRPSSFAFKGKQEDLRDIGQKLYDGYHGVMLGMKSITWALSKKVNGWQTLAYVPAETNYELVS